MADENPVINNIAAENDDTFETDVIPDIEDGLTEFVINGGIEEFEVASGRINNILIAAGYFSLVDKIINIDYQEVVNQSGLIDDAFLFSDDSLSVLNNLRAVDTLKFEGFGNAFTEQISSYITQVANTDITPVKAIRELKQIVNAQYKRNVSTWINTGLQNYYTESNVQIGLSNGINRFKYIGPKDSVTRPFGLKYIGQIKTIKQWDLLSIDPVRDKSAPTPVHTWLTGWNHRGTLIGVAA